MGTFEQGALGTVVLVVVTLHAWSAWLVRTQPAHPVSNSTTAWHGVARRWLALPLAWLLLCGPPGAVLYLVTTFVFAFSSVQGRMAPVVGNAFWVVELGALIVGACALARTRSLRSAVPLMLLTAGVGWCAAVGIEWYVASGRP
ncbi:MAG TPA: hypothetical protein VIL85_03485 [Thermomicrobiales bacterium]|jgi:hypothetical protein